ncbi:MAG: FtsQ-type POTRA domain-containing protein [Clostridiales bacterium]|nr:FtsQ-type POTRA domain-containing protein [Clostridiales bacterium]
MDGNNRPDTGGKFVRSSDPDFYVPSVKRTNNKPDNTQKRPAASGKNATGKKKTPAKRVNSKPSYSNNNPGRPESGRRTAGSQATRRQPYGGSKRSISDEKYRQYMYQVRKKQVMRNRIIAGAVLAVLIILAVVCFLSLTVWFPIKEFVVNSNNSAYSVSEIKQASKIIFNSDNLLRCDLKGVAKNIETTLPYVGKVTVDRKLPNTIVVDVEKTAAVAAVEHGRFVLLVNEEGKILQEAAEVPFGLRLVKYGTISQAAVGEIISSENGVPVSVYVSLIKAMRENGLNDITVIDISVPDNIVLIYQDRIDIKLGKAEDINIKIGVAVKALKDGDEKYSTVQKGTLDLTYPQGVAHFIPYVGKEEETDLLGDTEETTDSSVFDSPLKPTENGEENTTKKKDSEKVTEKTTKKKEEKTTEKKTEKAEEKTEADNGDNGDRESKNGGEGNN